MPCMKAGGTLEPMPCARNAKGQSLCPSRNGRRQRGQATGRARSEPAAIGRRTRCGAQQALIDALLKIMLELDHLKQIQMVTWCCGHRQARWGIFNEGDAGSQQVLKLDPRNVLALSQRGYAYFLLRDNGKGLADVNAALEIDDTPRPLLTRSGG